MKALKTITVVYLILSVGASIIGCANSEKMVMVDDGFHYESVDDLVKEHLPVGTTDAVASEFMTKKGFRCTREKNYERTFVIIPPEKSSQLSDYKMRKVNYEDCLSCSRISQNDALPPPVGDDGEVTEWVGVVFDENSKVREVVTETSSGL